MTTDTERSVGAELPSGWACAGLLELADLVRGVSYKRGEAETKPADGLTAVLRANNIGDRSLNFEDTKYVPDARVSDAQRLRTGDVLLAMSSGSKKVVGKAAAVREECDAGFGAFCGVLRPEGCVDPDFFALFFETDYYRQTVSRLSAGVNINNLKRAHFEELRVPLPPEPEQRRIVAAVAAVTGRADAAAARLRATLPTLARFRRSVFAAACDGRLTADFRPTQPPPEPATLQRLHRAEWDRFAAARVAAGHTRRQRAPKVFAPDPAVDVPDGWTPVTVSQIAQTDVGHAFRSKDFSEKGVRLLRGENVTPGSLRWEKVEHFALENAAEFDHLRVREGQIILAMDRPLISTGFKIARASAADAGCLLVQRVMRFRSVADDITSYLYLHLRSANFITHVTGGMTGSDLPHITGTGVAEFTFGLPPADEQHEIVRRTAALLARADAAEARVRAALAAADRLRRSALAKAFRGELLPSAPPAAADGHGGA